MKQKEIELQREIGKSIIIMEDLNITLTVIDGINRQKVNKNIKDFITHLNVEMVVFLIY